MRENTKQAQHIPTLGYQCFFSFLVRCAKLMKRVLFSVLQRHCHQAKQCMCRRPLLLIYTKIYEKKADFYRIVDRKVYFGVKQQQHQEKTENIKYSITISNIHWHCRLHMEKHCILMWLICADICQTIMNNVSFLKPSTWHIVI